MSPIDCVWGIIGFLESPTFTIVRPTRIWTPKMVRDSQMTRVCYNCLGRGHVPLHNEKSRAQCDFDGVL